jgi:arabinogalactan endo-1,4-beta-galactosidase
VDLKDDKVKIVGFLILVLLLVNCNDDVNIPKDTSPDSIEFYFGADLSYVNQILDYGGVYKDGGEVKSAYKIFKDRGASLVRLRLWHNPAWTKTVYTPVGDQMYNDILDVAKAIQLSKEQGLVVLLDFHYSDTWADPGRQEIPAAWQNIKTMEVLKDSVYNYTLKTLQYLEDRNLMPEFVQIGNETNCGMLSTSVPAGFPACGVCSGGNWVNAGALINRAIDAVNEVAASSVIKTKIILHVADPKNVEWWFDNMTNISKGNVSDFDIIGFSYYPLWHTTVSLDQLSDKVLLFKTKYSKEVMILETAYPWTTAADDGYGNLFTDETAVAGYPKTKLGQADIMKKITQEMIDGGGVGVIYWEPAWISSSMKDLWGTGSSWENNTFFDFDGNTIEGIQYMKYTYSK